MASVNREPRAGAVRQALIVNGATVRYTIQCGCGWKEVGNDAGSLLMSLQHGLDHAAQTGHTVQFQGEVRGRERA